MPYYMQPSGNFCISFRICIMKWPQNSPDLNPELSCVECISHTSPSLKTIPQLTTAMLQTLHDLLQATTNKDINEFCKHLNTSVSAGSGQFEHMNFNPEVHLTEPRWIQELGFLSLPSFTIPSFPFIPSILRKAIAPNCISNVLN